MTPLLPLTDEEIRPALRARLLATRHAERESVILEELGVERGRFRVDLVVVDSVLHGFEIKSDRDRLHRLSGQVRAYGRILDRATLVVGARNLAKAMAMVPGWWGVLLLKAARRRPRFQLVRRGKANPGRDPRALAELLWLDDAMSLLERRQAARGVRGKPRRMVWDRVCEHLGTDEIAAAVRTSLKARSATSAPPPPS
jgi:hypothetical protein